MNETEKAPGKSGALKTALWMLTILLVGGAVAGTVALLVFARNRRMARNEASAVEALRAYAEAQIMYHRNDWVGIGTPGVLEYATPYTVLNTQPDNTGLPIQLIDSAFAVAAGAGGIPKHGYLFMDIATIGGVPINWISNYGLCATPAEYGVTGRRTFIVTTNGVVQALDLGRSAFLEEMDYPASGSASDWVIAE